MPMERVLGLSGFGVQSWNINHVHMRAIIGCGVSCHMGVK